MKLTFWAYGRGAVLAGRYAGFCGKPNPTPQGTCECHQGCSVIEVAEFFSWRDAQEHGSFLAGWAVAEAEKRFSDEEDEARKALRCCEGCGCDEGRPCSKKVAYEIKVLGTGRKSWKCERCWTAHASRMKDLQAALDQEKSVSRNLQDRLEQRTKQTAPISHFSTMLARVESVRSTGLNQVFVDHRQLEAAGFEAGDVVVLMSREAYDEIMNRTAP